MKKVNCASVLALIAGTLAISTPAAASDLSISSDSIIATHERLAAIDLDGDARLGEVSHQQQQQVRRLALISGIVYAPSNSGFEV